MRKCLAPHHARLIIAESVHPKMDNKTVFSPLSNKNMRANSCREFIERPINGQRKFRQDRSLNARLDRGGSIVALRITFRDHSSGNVGNNSYHSPFLSLSLVFYLIFNFIF
jgi:hypothetical protein